MKDSDKYSTELMTLYLSLWRTSSSTLAEFCDRYGLDKKHFIAPQPQKIRSTLKFLPLA